MQLCSCHIIFSNSMVYPKEYLDKDDYVPYTETQVKMMYQINISAMLK